MLSEKNSKLRTGIESYLKKAFKNKNYAPREDKQKENKSRCLIN